MERDLFFWRRLCRELVFQNMLQHPLPWRVEQDWTSEVLASDGYCIAKCSAVDAKEVVAFAQEIEKELNDIPF